MLRPALHNGAWFEWNAHLPLFQASNAYTEDKLSTIKDANPTSQGALTDGEWVVLRYADAMTKDVKVPQALFDELKSHGGFNEQEIVEITTTVAGEYRTRLDIESDFTDKLAAYNMVSRFLVALDVAEMNDKPPADIAS